MKKFLKLFFSLLLTVISLVATPIQAAGENTVIAVDSVTANPGQSVEVPIRISNNSGIAGAIIRVSYDEKLVLTNVEKGSALSNLTLTRPGNLKANPVNIVLDGERADSTNGIAAICTFTAPSQAGSYAVNITVNYGDYLNDNLANITPSVQNGTITVNTSSVHTHKWQEGTVTKQPTCIEKGVRTQRCSLCSETKTSSIAALGHNIQNGRCTRCSLPGGYSGSDIMWTFDQDNGQLSFTGSGKMKNYTYISEVPWSKYAKSVTQVLIQDGLTNVSDYCFYGFDKLRSISIPETVTTVGAYSFKNCTLLENVKLPKKLSKIGESAFFSCSNLRGINIPEGVYTVWAFTFKNCYSLANVTLPSTLIKIDEAAFYGCSNLESLDIPNSVGIIGIYAFKHCSALRDVELPASLTEVREGAFYNCDMTIMDFPQNVQKIGPYSFKNCSALATVTLPSNLKSIGEAAFYSSGIRSVSMPNTVNSVGPYAFKQCTSLSSVQLSSALTTIAESMFYGCTALRSIELPAQVTEIKPYAFKGCSSLSTVTLNNNLKVIGESAFNTCTSLRNITIPQNVTTIGSYCFANDSALTSVTFNGNAPIIGEGAFKGVNCTASYSRSKTWSSSSRANYGGRISWSAV